MATSLHDTGEEYMLDVVMDGSVTRKTSVTVGVYNDATDTLADSSDLSAITTEPGGASYSRQTVNLNTTDVNNTDNAGDWESQLKSISFDMSDTTSGSVDSYFVVINYQSNDTSDTAATDHLFWTGSLDQSYSLSSVDTLNINANEMGLSLS